MLKMKLIDILLIICIVNVTSIVNELIISILMNERHI